MVKLKQVVLSYHFECEFAHDDVTVVIGLHSNKHVNTGKIRELKKRITLNREGVIVNQSTVTHIDFF